MSKSIEDLILLEILEAKEKRARMQRELIDIFRVTLVSFTLNIPGPEKNSADFTKVHENGIKSLEEEFNKQNIELIHKIVNCTSAGNEAFLNVIGDAMTVKRIAVSIEENHKLGRLFDIDVINKNGELISRSQLGLPERKCLICDNSAKVCARSRKHSIEELINKVNQIINHCN